MGFREDLLQWSGQPQEAAAPSQEALEDGLVLLYSCGVDLVTGNIATPTGQATQVVTAGGLAAGPASSSAAFWELPLSGAARSPQTALVVWEGGDTYHAIAGNIDGDSNNWLRIPGGNGGDQLFLDGVRHGWPSLSSLITSGVNVVAHTTAGIGSANGRGFTASSYISFYGNGNRPTRLCLGGASRENVWANRPLILFALFAGQLPQERLDRWTRDYEALIEPQLIWVPVTSGGGNPTVASQTLTSTASIVQGAIDFPQQIAAQTVAAPAASIVAGTIQVVQTVASQTVSAGAPTISAGAITLQQSVASQTLSAGSPAIVQGSISLPGLVASQVLSTPNPIIVQGAIDFPQSIASRTVTVTPVVSQGSITLIAAPAVAPTTVVAGQGQVVQGAIGLEGVSVEEFEEDAFALSYAAAWRRRSKTPAYFANRPSVSGTPTPGQILNASPGTWAPGATFVYQWMVGGVYVRNATSQTFTVRPEDAGKPIACCITANMPGGAKIPFVARV